MKKFLILLSVVLLSSQARAGTLDFSNLADGVYSTGLAVPGLDAPDVRIDAPSILFLRNGLFSGNAFCGYSAQGGCVLGMQFEFARPVKVTSIASGSYGPGDSARIGAIDPLGNELNQVAQLDQSLGGTQITDLSFLGTIKTLFIEVNGRVAFSSLRFEEDVTFQDPRMSQVPLPSSVLMLLSAIAALGLKRRLRA